MLGGGGRAGAGLGTRVRDPAPPLPPPTPGRAPGPAGGGQGSEQERGQEAGGEQQGDRHRAARTAQTHSAAPSQRCPCWGAITALGPAQLPRPRGPPAPRPRSQEASLPTPPLPLFRVVLEAGGVKSSDSRRNGRGWGSSVTEVLVKVAFSPEGAVG